MKPRSLAAGATRGLLTRLDPRTKFAWLAAISLPCVLVDSTAALVALGILAALPLAFVRLPPRGAAAIVVIVILLVWSIMLSQAMFYAVEPRTTLVELLPAWRIGSWELPPLRLYREGAAYGAVQSLRLVAGLLAGLSVCLSTSPDRLLGALTWLRVPASLSFLTTSALRFLPEAVDALVAIRRARRLRGGRSRSLIGRAVEEVLDTLATLGPMLALALRRSSNLAASVTMRGFDPGRRRTLYPPLRMSRGEMIAVCAMFWAVTAVAIVKALEYPRPF